MASPTASPTPRGAIRREIYIEWADRVYGPYASAAEAWRDGFILPVEPTEHSLE